MKNNFSCDSCRRKLSDYQLGFTDERENELIGAHLADCSGCRAEFEELKAVENLLRSSEKLPLPDDFKSVLHMKLCAESEKMQKENKGFWSVFGQIFSKNRVLVPVLSAFILVAVFSTGIYELMLNQQRETEIQNEAVTAAPSPAEYNNAGSTNDSPESTAAAEDKETASDKIYGSSVGTAAPERKNVSDKSSSPAPDAEYGGELSENKAANKENEYEDSKSGSVDNGIMKKSVSQADEDRGGDETQQSEEALLTDAPALSAYRMYDFPTEDDSDGISEYGFSASGGGGGGVGGASSAYNNSAVPESAAAGAAESLRNVRIELRNPAAFLANVGLADRASVVGGEYTLYLSAEEYGSLVKQLPKSAEVISEQEINGESAENEALYCVTIAVKR